MWTLTSIDSKLFHLYTNRPRAQSPPLLLLIFNAARKVFKTSGETLTKDFDPDSMKLGHI